jgi:two-component system, NarL family, response regulator
MSSFELSKIAAAPDSSTEIEALSNAGEQSPIRVVIAMSSRLERMAWGIIVERQSDMRLVAQAASCNEALTILKTHDSDVTLIDEDMLNAGHYRALQEYSRQPSSSRFILVAPHEVDYSLEHSGFSFAHAYMLKGFSAAEFLEVIRTTADEPGS